MTVSSPIRFMSPEEIATRDAGAVPHLRFADPSAVFRDRAQRLRQLAAGHPMRDFLLFMAALAEAQQAALGEAREARLPTEASLAEAAREGLAPVGFPRLPLDGGWRDELGSILSALTTVAGLAAEAVARLRDASPEWLDRQAEALLSGVMFRLDLAAAPLLGAALQVHWTRLVARTREAFPELAFGRIADARVCPCCGSRPVASVARIGGEEAGARYLRCGLCQTEWHMVRIQCSRCEGVKDVFYQELEPVADAAQPTVAVPRGAVRAECCGECGHYLKIVDMARDAHVEPVADDLASLALDLLVSESGLTRHGVNLMLVWGDPEAPPGRAEPPGDS